MMKRTKHGTLDGRAVELREVPVVVALEANKQGEGFLSALFVLVHAAHWQDSGERVFASVEQLTNEWPMRLLPEINALAALSGQLNLGQDDEPAATLALPNGNGGEVVVPSH